MVGLDPLSADLVGRERELGLLEQHVKAAVSGERRAIVLVGPPGIGKTTLLRWCVGRLATERVALATVRVPTAAGLPPRYPIGEILTGLRRSAERLKMTVPEPLARAQQALERLDPQNPFPISLPQVADAIESIGERLPVAILIDDWHAVPTEGGELLLAALRVIGTPLFLAFTARDSDRRPERSAVPLPSADLRTDRLSLAPLSTNEIAQLTTALLGQAPLPSLVSAIESRTSGNPLLVQELLKSWKRGGLLMEAGSYCGLMTEPGPRLPQSLTDLAANRVSALDLDALDVLGLLSIWEREVTFEDLLEVTGWAKNRIAGALSRLDGQGLLSILGGVPTGYRVRHLVYQQAGLDLLDSVRLAGLHEAIFLCLCRRREGGGLVRGSELAHHGLRGLTEPTNLKSLLEEAAQEADAVGSYHEAATWYSHLVNRCTDSAERRRALTRQGTALLNTSPSKALELFTAAINEGAELDDLVDLKVMRARAFRRVGKFDRAFRDLKTALQIATPKQTLEIKSWIAPLLGLMGRVNDAEALLLELTHTATSPALLSGVYSDLSVVAENRGEMRLATEFASRSRQLAGDPSQRCHAAINEGWMRAIRGQWRVAADIHEEAIKIASAAGDIYNLILLKTNLATIRGWQGRFPLAYDLCISAERHSAQLGRISDRIDVLDAWGAVHLEAERPIDALQVLTEAASLLDEEREVYDVVVLLSSLAEALRNAGTPDEALSWLEEAESRGIRPPLWRIRVGRVRASCLLDLDKVLEAKNVAVASLEDPLATNPYERAKTIELLAQIHFALGVKQGSEALLGQAHSEYVRLGALHSAERCAKRRQRRRGRPKARLQAKLSPREMEVAQHVAAGWSDREIARLLGLSERTVSKHVSNILARINAKRRGQITLHLQLHHAEEKDPKDNYVPGGQFFT